MFRALMIAAALLAATSAFAEGPEQGKTPVKLYGTSAPDTVEAIGSTGGRLNVAGTVSGVAKGATAAASGTVTATGADHNSQDVISRDAAGNVVAPLSDTQLRAAPVPVEPAPQVAWTGPTEQCVTNAAGGTTIAVPANTRILCLQNLDDHIANCTTDNSAPVSNTTGWQIAGWSGVETDPADSVCIPVKSSSIALKCIAKTAAQVSGACLQMWTGQ